MKSIGEWAFSVKSQHLAQTIRERDNGIVYLRTEGNHIATLGGEVEFLGVPFMTDRKALFDQLFPLRIRVNVAIVADPLVPFPPLVPKINFIKNKSNWGGYLQGQAARRLDDGDYRFLESILRMK